MCLRNWVKFLSLVLLTWVLFNLVIEASIVRVAFTNALFVAYANEFYE